MTHPWHDSEEFPKQCAICGSEDVLDHFWMRWVNGEKIVGNGKAPKDFDISEHEEKTVMGSVTYKPSKVDKPSK